MISRLILILILFVNQGLQAADSFPAWAWELYSFTTPFRASAMSSGPPPGSAAVVSPSIVTETAQQRSQDNLPPSGLYGKGWPSTSTIDLSCYIEFTVTPNNSGRPLYVGYVQMPLFRETMLNATRGEEGPRKWVLRWSRDNYAANLGAEFDMSSVSDRSEKIFRVDLWQHPPTSDAITFRLYGYDAPSIEGCGGCVVVTHKLYVAAGTRPPLLNISPRVLQFTSGATSCSVEFEGSYGSTYGLEVSTDLNTWSPAGVADRTVTDIENSERFTAAPKPADSNVGFYRVVKKE